MAGSKPTPRGGHARVPHCPRPRSSSLPGVFSQTGGASVGYSQVFGDGDSNQLDVPGSATLASWQNICRVCIRMDATRPFTVAADCI